MDTTKTIDTQVTLPIKLYQSIVQRAEISGHSVSDEIVSLLSKKAMFKIEIIADSCLKLQLFVFQALRKRFDLGMSVNFHHLSM